MAWRAAGEMRYGRWVLTGTRTLPVVTHHLTGGEAGVWGPSGTHPGSRSDRNEAVQVPLGDTAVLLLLPLQGEYRGAQETAFGSPPTQHTAGRDLKPQAAGSMQGSGEQAKPGRFTGVPECLCPVAVRRQCGSSMVGKALPSPSGAECPCHQPRRAGSVCGPQAQREGTSKQAGRGRTGRRVAHAAGAVLCVSALLVPQCARAERDRMASPSSCRYSVLRVALERGKPPSETTMYTEDCNFPFGPYFLQRKTDVVTAPASPRRPPGVGCGFPVGGAAPGVGSATVSGRMRV